MQGEHKYFPENWKPLERWLPVAFCRSRFAWMWNDRGYECYRHRDSGELLYLDGMGQCWEMTEIGLIPADFANQFERCTGRPYPNSLNAAAQQLSSDEDVDEDCDLPAIRPPNGNSLGRILQHWAAEQDVDPMKLDSLLNELDVHNTMLLAEQEEQCNTLLKTTRCWLK